VFAKVPVKEDGKTKQRVTAFIVDAHAPGISLGKIEEKMGIKASDTRAISFVNVQVPAADRLGDVGQGFKIALEILNSGRLGLAAASSRGARHILDIALAYAKQREQFGRSIGSFEMIQRKFAVAAAECYASDAAWMLTASMVDRGGIDFSLETAACKIFASELAFRASCDAQQIAGGIGYSKEYPYEQAVRDSRINLIFEGTNEILRAFIALSGMQGPGRELADVARAMREPIKGFGLLSDFAIRKARGALGRERMSRHHPILKREAVVFEEYVQELAQGVDRVLRKHGRDIAEMQYTQKRTAELVIELYAVAACIARTTYAIERRGEEGARREIDLTSIFVAAAEKRMEQIVDEVDKNDDELRKSVASKTYDDGGYPFDAV
jgi:acyl-CoA dehydrogenase family protein 9